MFNNKPGSTPNTGATPASSSLFSNPQSTTPASSSLFGNSTNTTNSLFGNNIPKSDATSPAPSTMGTNMFGNPSTNQPPPNSNNPAADTKIGANTSATNPPTTTNLFGNTLVSTPNVAPNPNANTALFGTQPTNNLFGGTNTSQANPLPSAPSVSTIPPQPAVGIPVTTNANSFLGAPSTSVTNPIVPNNPIAPSNPIVPSNPVNQATLSTPSTNPPTTSLAPNLFGANTAATSPAQPASTQPVGSAALGATSAMPAAVSPVIVPETPRSLAQKQYRSLHHNLGDMIDKWRRESECYVEALESHLIIQQEIQNEKSVLSSSSKGFALVKTEVEVGEGKVENILDSIEEKQMRLLQSVRIAELEIGSLTGPFARAPNQIQETFSDLNCNIRDIQQIQSHKVSPSPTLEYLNLMYGNLQMIEREVREMNNSLETLLSDKILN